MEWVLTLVVSPLVAVLTAYLTALSQREKLKAELQLQYSVEEAIRHLLLNTDYKRRSLKKIKRHLRGFESDNELRMALIRSGAVVVSGEGEDELWGLLDRNRDAVK